MSHLHRYKKANLARTSDKPYWIYKCMKPDCSHYIATAMADGKLCECNRCGKPMILGKLQLNGSGGRPMTKPHCFECVERKSRDDAAKITEFLEENET